MPFMTTSVSRTLSELRLDPITFPVADELAGLERLLPEAPDEIEGFSLLASQTPSILDIRGRALSHTIQMDRFIVLANDDLTGLTARVDTANALTILGHAGKVALLLVPARTEEDRWVQAEVAHERKRAARSSRRDAALLQRALSAAPPRIKEHRLDDASALPDAVTTMARFVGAILPAPTNDRSARPGVPGAYTLEDAHSLEAYFAAPPDLTELVTEARDLLKRSDGWSQDTRHPADMVEDARRGAWMLAYARLARVGLWPARSQVDLEAKWATQALVDFRGRDPDHLRALAQLALDVGRLIAGQSDRFLSTSGVEL